LLSRIIRRRCEAEIAVQNLQIAQIGGGGGDRLVDIEGSVNPRRAADPGMNWAMPSAPAGLTAAGSNRLSFQMRRAKKSGGRK
jgi:hypothetical protein